MRTITLSPAGKQPVRIATTLSFGADINVGSKNDQFADAGKKIKSGSISRTLSAACSRIVCNCAPHKLIRAAFSGKAIFAVAVAMIVAMMWHNITINDPVAAGEAVAYDCIYAMPWLIVWTIRATLSSIKEGGEL